VAREPCGGESRACEAGTQPKRPSTGTRRLNTRAHEPHTPLGAPVPCKNQPSCTNRLQSHHVARATPWQRPTKNRAPPHGGKQAYRRAIPADRTHNNRIVHRGGAAPRRLVTVIHSWRLRIVSSNESNPITRKRSLNRRNEYFAEKTRAFRPSPGEYRSSFLTRSPSPNSPPSLAGGAEAQAGRIVHRGEPVDFSGTFLRPGILPSQSAWCNRGMSTSTRSHQTPSPFDTSLGCREHIKRGYTRWS